MEVIKTKIPGVVIIEPRLFPDARGYFFESFSKRELKKRWARLILCRTTRASRATVCCVVCISKSRPTLRVNWCVW